MSGQTARMPRGAAPLARTLARIAIRHPEWWTVLLAAGAWALLVVWHAAPAPGVTTSGAFLGHVHGGSGVTSSGLPGVLSAATGWCLMVVAMMGIVMIPRIRTVAFASLGRLRTRAIAGTLAGAMLTWFAVGIPVLALAALLPPLDATTAPLGFAAVWLAAAAWQLTRLKQLSLVRCHNVEPVRGPLGGRQFEPGARYGAWCAVSCGPAMAAMTLTGHPLPLAVVLTAGFALERTTLPSRLTVPLLAAATIGTALVVGAVGMRF